MVAPYQINYLTTHKKMNRQADEQVTRPVEMAVQFGNVLFAYQVKNSTDEVRESKAMKVSSTE